MFKTAVWCVMVSLLLVAQPTKAEMPKPTRVVDTTSGPVQGLVESGIPTFKGIPYGAPPTGEMRFLPPKPVSKSEARIDATGLGAPCMQMAAGTTAVPTSDFGLQLKTVFPTPSEMKVDNEDCLFLNIWTPATDAKKRPVMVWFHGGGFAYGSGGWPVYDGENLARRGDVVVVTVNHRLNIFGYLALADAFGDAYAASGNAGMADLVLSLQWVRDNISQFGGDPGNVTIMGESGGGSKVSHLLAMEPAKGLFHKGIIQSGPGLLATPGDKAIEITDQILGKLDVPKTAEGLRKLQQLSADTLLEAAHSIEGLRFGPVVDGVMLKRHPFTPDAPATAADVPIIIGANKDEMTLFQASMPWFGQLTMEQLEQQVSAMPKGTELLAAYREVYPEYSPTHLMSIISSSRFVHGSEVLAERKAAQKAPVYMYFVTWETPVNDGMFRSPHTVEMPFMFDTVKKSAALVGTGADAQKMADQMSEAWIAFARSGNPNHKGIPKWPTYDAGHRQTMIFNVPSRVQSDPQASIRKILAAGD
jgi:para-nitrobenzyl esterase